MLFVYRSLRWHLVGLIFIVGMVLDAIAVDPTAPIPPMFVTSLSSSIHKDISSALVLDNGMEVVLIENHANPMVACFVIVRCGQRDETEDVAGVSHFLEHAIFDGTENRSKKQLYDDFDFLGSYVNASTKHDFTEFFILSPKENFPASLDLLRDMIFHSVFPADTLEQERGIVLEEIGKDLDRPSEQADNLFYRMMYQGTPYRHSILGSTAGIGAISREEVVDYYQTYYVPNNMICVVIGDFQPKEMMGVVDAAFGQYPPGEVPEKELLNLSSFFTTAANRIVFYRGDVDKCYLRVGIEAPTVWSEDYYAMQVLIDILETQLEDKLITPDDSLITGVSMHYFEDRDFATLNFYLDVPANQSVYNALIKFHTKLSQIRNWITEDRVDAVMQARLAEDILQGQRLHMYGMLNSHVFARGGYPLWRYWDTNFGAVTVDQLHQVADKDLIDAPFIATCLVPFPEVLDTETMEPAETLILEATLDNRMRVIIQQNMDAPIFAAHLLAKGRAFHEGRERAGYADMIHRMFSDGSQIVGDMSLSDALQQIGANLVTTDMAFIPYDDYRTTPTHSFVRLECLDDFRNEALDILGQIVTQPNITPESLSKVKQELTGIVSSKEARTTWKADRLFVRKILGDDHPLAQSEFGTMMSVEAATLEGIQDFYNSYFSGANLILTIVTSGTPEIVLDKVTRAFSTNYAPGKDRHWAGLFPPIEYPTPPNNVSGRFEEVHGKKQSAVRLGTVFRAMNPEDRAALQLWNRRVSDQLAFVIREEHGWAYSVGSSVWFVDDWAVWQARWGTAPANVDSSIVVAKDIVQGCLEEMLSSHEMEKLVNQLLRGGGMRRMTRINQAMYLGLSEMDGQDRDWDHWSASIRTVTGEKAHQTVGKYFDIKKVLEVVVR